MKGNAAAAATEASLPEKPSIASLPFQNLSGDPEQEYFADGAVEASSLSCRGSAYSW
jgi:TolB-like protein